MNILETVIAAEKKADEMLQNAEIDAQKAIETARKKQQETISAEKMKLEQATLDAVVVKEKSIQKAVQTIESETNSTVNAIKQGFVAKKTAAVAVVKKYFS